MTLEQTVEIPESRKVQFSTEVPVGRFRIVFFPAPPESDSVAEMPEFVPDPVKYPWEKSLGKYKNFNVSSEEIFKERARDLLMEEVKFFGKISPEALEKAAKRGVTPAELGLEKFV